MSNTLQKLFNTSYVLVPGRTIRRWNRPETVVQSMPFPTNVGLLNYAHIGQFGDIYYTFYQWVDSGPIMALKPYRWRVNIDDNESRSYSSVEFIALDNSWSVTVAPEPGQIASTGGQWRIYSTGNVQVKVDYVYNNMNFWFYPTDVQISITKPGYYSYETIPDYYELQYNPNKGWNSSARSIASILGDGTATFSSRIDTTGAVVGLNELYDSLGSNYFEISYGILFANGYYSIVEQGTRKTGKNLFDVSDVFSISRVNDDIFYLKNDVVFYKSLIPSTDELLLDCSLYAAGDSVYNASLVPGSSIIASAANITATSSIYAQPRATADITAQSTTGFTGVYSIGDEAHALANINAISSNQVTQAFGGYPAVTATATLTAISNSKTGVSASLGAMTALLTSGYEFYAEIKASFTPMTAQAGIGELTIENTYIAAAFEGLSVDAIGLTGETTLDTIMALPAMTMLAADHPYAAISGTLSSMNAQAGEFADYGNYAIVPFITSSILASGYSTDLNSGTLTFIDSTIEGYGGAITEEEAVNFADFSTFSCTGTHLDYGNANIAFSAFTLSSTGIGYGTSNASIGFISSTITSFSGANAAIAAPVFSLAGTGSYIPLGGADIGFLTWSVSSTGTLDAIGNATIGFPTFTSIWGSAALPAPFLNLAATGSVVIANSVAYVLNIVTNESTRYTNQIWDHIVVLGNKPYGVTSTGLYLLEGATDNGVAIDTYMATKETDLGSNMAKSIPTIYLNSDTQTYTTAYMDGVAQTPQASSFTGRKCHLSRGAEARYVKLKISGIKNLQGLEILPELKSRRVK